MKKPLLAILGLAFALCAQAQVQFNPQFGLTFQSLTNAPEQQEYRSNVGWIVGADVRVGERLYVQPGFFLARSSTAITTLGADSTTLQTTLENDVIRTYVKARAMLGFKLINGDQFKLRLAVGPSYDVLTSVDLKGEGISWGQDDYTTGVWNLEVGLGLDMAFITLEPGVSFGLTNVYRDDPPVSDIDSKYFTFSITAGIVLGRAE